MDSSGNGQPVPSAGKRARATGRTGAGLKITAGQRKMSALMGALTGQAFVLPVMLTGHVHNDPFKT